MKLPRTRALWVKSLLCNTYYALSYVQNNIPSLKLVPRK